MGLLLALLIQAAQAPTPAPTSAAARPTAVQDYEIGSEDVLKVTVYGHDDLSLSVVVQSDGTFMFPLIGRVKAADLTTKELEQKLTVLLGQGYIRNPQVAVNVQEHHSKTVYVVGEVSRPGPYPLSAGRTLVEVLSRAGPMLVGAGSEVVVIRPAVAATGPVLPPEADAGPEGETTVAGQSEVTRIDIRRLQAGEAAQNVVLQPGDTVFIPQAPKVFVSGEVRNPGAYSYAPGMTVRQAISLAGGFTEHASSGRLRVVRQSDGKAREIKVKIDDVVKPGDTLVVKESWF
jgi:polysaccharide export outer membrane protein